MSFKEDPAKKSSGTKKSGGKFFGKPGKGAPKKSAPKPVKKILPPGWYYMAPEEMTVADLKSVLDGKGYNLEIWTEVGVLEIGIAEKASVDIETCELDMGDEYSNAYLAEHQVKTLFYLAFPDEQEEAAMKVMKEILAAKGGRICGDTDDFTPVIR